MSRCKDLGRRALGVAGGTLLAPRPMPPAHRAHTTTCPPLARGCAAQVSGYGSDGQSDGGDVWVVEWEAKGKYWRQDLKVGPQGGGGRQRMTFVWVGVGGWVKVDGWRRGGGACSSRVGWQVAVLPAAVMPSSELHNALVDALWAVSGCIVSWCKWVVHPLPMEWCWLLLLWRCAGAAKAPGHICILGLVQGGALRTPHCRAAGGVRGEEQDEGDRVVCC